MQAAASLPFLSLSPDARRGVTLRDIRGLVVVQHVQARTCHFPGCSWGWIVVQLFPESVDHEQAKEEGR